MMLKDNNFISAVVYLHNDGARAVEFCRTVAAELDANFKQYELVVVDLSLIHISEPTRPY